MPTRVEEICKRIHILFAKGEAYQNSPDLVILSKTEMFSLLEELNEAMYEVLDQYEATTRAKEKARIETEREASEIIAKAKIGAEDVQAVTFAYADTMMDEVSAFIETMTQNIRDQYLGFLASMDEKQADIKENRDQIKGQLSELHDRETYLKLLEEIREDAKEAREEEEAEAKKEAEKEKELDEGKTPSKTGAKKSEEEISEEEFPPPPKAPAPVIRVNRPGENPGVTFTTRRSHNKKKKTAPPVSKQVNTMSEEDYNRLSPEEREELEQSTPAYGQGFNADDFNLDAEYEQFKREEEAKNKANETSKKGSFKLFGKKRK
ncbi:MAG: hypothetical protein IKP88_13435 [Lachnospiraceae bacterium]|nr:hypothetical protein [Lachnospiraceae bacterium]